MKNRFLELVSWEFRDNWAFPILEIVIALTIVQTLSYTSFSHDYYSSDPFILKAFFESMLFVLVLSVAVVFGRSFGESIEKRKLVVLLSYPVSRARLFLAKYLTNFLVLFLIFGLGLLAQGTTLFLFDGVIPPVAWSFAFLYLLLDVFFASSLMTFFALATKRFGLSILLFLVYMFGMQYWIPFDNRNPITYLLLDLASYGSVQYLASWYFNTLDMGRSGTWVSDTCFLTALAHMVVGGLVLFLASFVIIKRMDLD